jgi:nicotinamide riboside transporter PnuC
LPGSFFGTLILDVLMALCFQHFILKGKNMLLSLLEWIGAIGGAAGSLLLAFNTRHSGYGFILYLISSAGWIAYALLTDTYSMLAMQVVCTGTASLGIWRWLVVPSR